MPILAIDRFGRIYETSPDRMDGLGYKSHARPVEQGDLTLGNAYLKSQAAYRSDVMRDRAAIDQESRWDLATAVERSKRFMGKRQREAEEIAMQQQPNYRKLQTMKALKMNGCSSCQSTPLSGDGLTANGQKGWLGMSRDQQVIHQHLAPNGANAAFPVDRTEARQREMEARAAQQIVADARRAASRS